MLDRLLRILVAQILCLVVSVSVASAADCYMGCKLSSPNGRLLLIVKRTVRGKPPYGQSIDTSTYTLYDLANHKTLWKRKWSHGKFFSARISLNDTGLIIGWQGTRAFALNSQGKPILNLHRYDLLTESMRQFSEEATAGTNWGLSDWIGYFVLLNNREAFAIRTWWGEHFLVQLDSKEIIPVPSQQIETIRTQESRYLVDSLIRAAEHGPPTREQIKEGNPVSELRAAVLAAGQLGVTRSIAALQQIETWDYADNCNYVRGVDSPSLSLLQQIHPDRYAWNSLRAAVHLSLRRLGARPKAFSPIRHCFDDSLPASCKAFAARMTRPREASMDKIRLEMKPYEILNLIGEPDYVVFEGEKAVWEYDPDKPTNTTLKITWSLENPGVMAIERISPPKWKLDAKFTRERLIIF